MPLSMTMEDPTCHSTTMAYERLQVFLTENKKNCPTFNHAINYFL
jgi:hypothetical protein